MLLPLTCEVFARVMYWNLKANEHAHCGLSATDLYDQITVFWPHEMLTMCALTFSFINRVVGSS